MAKKDTFPGFEACLQMMYKHDPQIQEDGYHWLLPHAGQYAEQLMRAFSHEDKHGIRRWLLDLIGEAKSATALPLLAQCLKDDDADLRVWAIRGLMLLNTKEARSALHEAQSYTFATEEETTNFREDLEIIRQHQRVQEGSASPVPPELGARGQSCL